MNKAFKIREHSTKCCLTINTCRKLLFTLVILISRNDIELFSSISDVNLILGCWQLR